MKKLIIILCLLIALPVGALTFFGSTQDASKTLLSGYFGGTAGKLDAISGDILSDGDMAIVSYTYGTVNEMVTTWHILRVGVDETETTNDITWIVPDINSGTYPNNKIWYRIPDYAWGTATPHSTVLDGMDYQERD